MIYRTIKKIIPTSAVSISIAVFVIASLIVTHISRNYYDGDFMENVLVEAHGMLFDILVIGVLILFLNKLVEKRIENRRHLDEIDDFRGWESEEAAYRIAGNLRRLKRNGYKGEIDLKNCYLGCVDMKKDSLLEYFKKYLTGIDLVEGDLQSAKLNDADLQSARLMKANLHLAYLRSADLRGADCQDANLMHTILTEAKLEHADFRKADLKKAKLQGANLQGAKLMRANLRGADLQEAHLQGADLQEADLQEADLQEADLRGANLLNANLLNANLQYAQLRGVRNLTLDQLSVVKSLYGAKLDPELW